MSDDPQFNPAAEAPPGMSAPGGMFQSQYGSLPADPAAPAPPASPAAMETAINHMLMAHDQMMQMLNHAAAMLPSLGGMEMMRQRVMASLGAARAAMSPTPPPDGPQQDHS